MLITESGQYLQMEMAYFTCHTNQVLTKVFCSQLLGNVQTLFHLSAGIGQNMEVRVGGSAVHVPVM